MKLSHDPERAAVNRLLADVDLTDLPPEFTPLTPRPVAVTTRQPEPFGRAVQSPPAWRLPLGLALLALWLAVAGLCEGLRRLWGGRR